MSVNRKLKFLKPFLAMEILQESQKMSAQGQDVISLSIGEPDLNPPEVVKEACIKALKEGQIKYTHSQGLITLREALCEHYLKTYQVKLHPDQFFLTSGSSPAFLLALGLLLNPGDEVLMTDPHYPCYLNFVHFFQAKPKFITLKEKNDYQLSLKLIQKKISKKTKAILLNSPANPTGFLVGGEIYEGLNKKNLSIISDEIYHGLVYDSIKERSALEFNPDSFVLNGFSKAYAMTGYRLGYLIAPLKYQKTLQILAQNLFISPNTFVQYAALAALKAVKEQEKIRNTFQKRRDFALAHLDKIGLKPGVVPQGAFYLFLNIEKYSKNSLEFCQQLLKKEKLGLSPGIDFGPAGEGHIRLSYANSMENIEEGIARLGRFLERWK